MIQTDKSEKQIVVPLRLSPARIHGAAASVLLGTACLGAFFLAPLPIMLMRLLPFFAVLCFLPLARCFFIRSRARLILSERGLRWRTGGDWRQVSWDGVQDFYDHPWNSDGTSDGLMTLETEAGDVTLHRRWPGSGTVRQWVEERARHVETADWDRHGQRAGGMSVRVSFYDQKDFWPFMTASVGFILLTLWGWHGLLLPMIATTSWKSLAALWFPSDFWGSLIEIASTTLLVLLMFSFFYIINLPLLLALAIIPGMVDTRRRRGERITTSADGIAFADGQGRTITANWSDVTGYFFGLSAQYKSRLLRATALSSSLNQKGLWVYTVETKHGSFQYSPFISGAGNLGETIRESSVPVQYIDPDTEERRPG